MMRLGESSYGFGVWFIFIGLNFAFCLATENDLKFDLKWRGDFSLLDDHNKENLEIMDFMIGDSNYKYRCVIPMPVIEQSADDKKVLNERIETSSLLNEIYTKKLCSYRIESYWIYELCHGVHVKQYHETKNTGMRSVTATYFLGKYNKDIQEPDYTNDVPNIHWRTLDGVNVATYPVRYNDGTPCEILPGVSREITIFYVCSENGNDNIVSFEEVSSCLYEMTVVTRSICAHPAYRPNTMPPKSIDCYSIDGSPANPETEETHDVKQTDYISALKMTDNEGKEFIVHYVKNDKMPNSEASNIEAMIAIEEEPGVIHTLKIKKDIETSTKVMGNEENAVISSFLNGDTCLTGGTGWWKFEICYGKQVIQFHEDENSNQRVSTVLLGTWNIEAHLEYMQKYPHKKPAKDSNERSTFSHFYSNGQFCEVNNKNRHVEVRFKCPKPDSNPPAVSLFLIEPMTCEYLLGIESPWFCDLVKNVDVNGLPSFMIAGNTEN